MSPFKAKVERRTGFSDPKYYVHDVVVVGFVYGTHKDAVGYDRSGQCTMAVCMDGNNFYTVPLSCVVAEVPE